MLDVLSCPYTKLLLCRINYLNNFHKLKVDISIILKSIRYAKKYHSGQYRQSGEPYYSHPLEVAYMLCDYSFKTEIIVTAILHDTLEDTQATKEEIAELFGARIVQNVIALTRFEIDGVKTSSAEMVILLLKNKQRDLLVVKLLDRLHNIRTIEVKPAHKIRKIIRETKDVFIDLASYLQIQEVKNELIYICSKYAYLFDNYNPIRHKDYRKTINFYNQL